MDFLNVRMREAIAEAQRWIGSTSPNPPVGAIAVTSKGEIIAKSAHHQRGELHAEAKLINACRENGTLGDIDTLFVTLEPCNHAGTTPPCSEAIIAAGIKHIIIGTRDPNQIAKGGLEKINSAGICVTCGIEEERCNQLAHAFLYNVATNSPWITVKRAFNEKGSMIPPQGQKVFTSNQSLILAHRLRKMSDAIMTGGGTILADNPQFDVRLVKDYGTKRRKLAILSRTHVIPQSYLAEARQRRLDPTIYAGIEDAMEALSKKSDLNQTPAQHILVEAGPTLSQAILDSQFWTMSVSIHKGPQGAPDKINVEFNREKILPFNSEMFDLENILPLDQPKAS